MILETTIFKSGNSAALRLPKELGISVGTTVRLEKTPRGLTITPIEDVVAAQKNNADLAERLRAIWSIEEHPAEQSRLDQGIRPDR